MIDPENLRILFESIAKQTREPRSFERELKFANCKKDVTTQSPRSLSIVPSKMSHITIRKNVAGNKGRKKGWNHG